MLRGYIKLVNTDTGEEALIALKDIENMPLPRSWVPAESYQQAARRVHSKSPKFVGSVRLI